MNSTKNKPASSSPELLVIVGATASGKSDLAMKIAQMLGGEIICADSRTIYKGMDIGTAKPSEKDQKMIPHHLLDIVEPDQSFSASQFKDLAIKAISEIVERGKLPILVGGSGLYIDSVLFDFQFRPVPEPAERERLNAMSIEELQQEIHKKGLPMPGNSQNKRHLTRTIETDGVDSEKKELRANTVVVGLAPPKAVIVGRIRVRIEAMIEAGLVSEVERLAETYGWDAPGMSAPAYRTLRSHVEGSSSLTEAASSFAAEDKKLAKRQLTWFKRNPAIHWFENGGDAAEFIKNAYNKH